jgi:hypothetical protein
MSTPETSRAFHDCDSWDRPDRAATPDEIIAGIVDAPGKVLAVRSLEPDLHAGPAHLPDAWCPCCGEVAHVAFTQLRPEGPREGVLVSADGRRDGLWQCGECGCVEVVCSLEEQACFEAERREDDVDRTEEDR